MLIIPQISEKKPAARQAAPAQVHPRGGPDRRPAREVRGDGRKWGDRERRRAPLPDSNLRKDLREV